MRVYGYGIWRRSRNTRGNLGSLGGVPSVSSGTEKPAAWVWPPPPNEAAMVPTSVPSAQAHAEIATTIAVMPDQAKGMMRREPFADLARQNGALHGGNDHPFEFN